MELTLKVELGNDAMKDGSDLSAALKNVANRFESEYLFIRGGEEAKIYDANGNHVGSWSVSHDGPKTCGDCGKVLAENEYRDLVCTASDCFAAANER